MKVSLENVGGEIIKDNETYILRDNNFLENLTLSQTILKPGQSTRGHSHDAQEEVYIFTLGNGTMIIGDEEFDAKTGDTFLIKSGKFHRVINKSNEEFCHFTCVFEKYDRSGKEAIYKSFTISGKIDSNFTVTSLNKTLSGTNIIFDESINKFDIPVGEEVTISGTTQDGLPPKFNNPIIVSNINDVVTK